MSSKKMQKHLYEGMYILRPTLSEDAREKAINKVTSLIAELGGELDKTIHWGRRKMTFEMKGCREGHYYLIYFSLPTHEIDEMIRENHLHEDLLRFMHVLIDEVPEGDQIVFKSLSQ